MFDKVDALLGKAIMSIPAVKGFEIGRGFEAATLRGEENADEIYSKNKKIFFKSKYSKGTLCGITSGQDFVIRFAVKPTSSILNEKSTVNLKGKIQKLLQKVVMTPVLV